MITTEMIKLAFSAWWDTSEDENGKTPQMRAALEAVAPALIAQGMREAAAICDGEPEVAAYEAAILKRAQELDPR